MVRRENSIADLMDKFVCVRVIQMNAVDLAQYQFDYDMSFAVFFQNADGAIYGRFGTRSTGPQEADKEITMDGLRAAMEGALALHKAYPGNAAQLAGKRGPEPRFAVPERYPKLGQFKPELDYSGKLAQSCIHCHQVRDAERDYLRRAKQPISDRELFPYPLPDAAGLTLDKDTRATVEAVAAGTPAAVAGLKPGDEILAAAGQPLLSIADFQWVLHNAGDSAQIPLRVRRAGKAADLDLKLPSGWRTKVDFGWRTSTWDLRRIAFGGMKLDPDPEGNAKAPLLVKHVGKYGEHARAMKAGVKVGDRLLRIAGLESPPTESAAITHVLRNVKAGEPIKMTLLRGSREIDVTVEAQ